MNRLTKLIVPKVKVLRCDWSKMASSKKPLSSIVPIEIRECYDTTLVKDIHLHCECGHNQRARVVGIHDGWALWLQCTKPTCSCTWYVCNRCADVRKKITDKDALKRHHKKQHIKSKRSIADLVGEDSMRPSNAATVAPPLTHATTSEPTVDDEMGFPPVGDELEYSHFCTDTGGENGEKIAIKKRIVESFTVSQSDLDFDKIECPCPEFANNLQSGRYFQNCHDSKESGGGVKFLVKQSIASTDYLDEDLKRVHIPEHHVQYHMTLAKLATILSKTYHPLLVDVVRLAWEIGCEDGFRSSQELINKDWKNYYADMGMDKRLFRPYRKEYINRQATFKVPIPKTTNDIRQYFTESKFSILQNLPCPRIQEDVKDHAYVSIVDCIRHFFGHGKFKIPIIPDRSGLTEDAAIISHCSESKRAQDIRRNGMEVYSKIGIKPLCSYLLFWSDDFEPNAMSKSARGSAWIKTMTIATTKEDGHTVNNTYVVAIGKKSKSHDEVEQRINDDLEQLQSGTLPPFYLGTAKCAVHIHFELLATLQDQPERRSANHLIAGNGRLSARWCVSGDHTYLYDRLRCCATCLQVMRKRYEESQWNLPLPDCSNCLNWDILKESPVAIFPAPDGYPTVEQGARCRTVFVDNKQYIKPFRIDYEGLIESIAFAHFKYADGSWTKKNCEVYLKVEGINDAAVETFMEHAIYFRSLQIVTSDDIRQTLLEDRQLNPKKYDMMVPPPLWQRKNVFLWTHVDSIMHMLFLGIVKTVVVVYVTKWLKAVNKHTSFVEDNARYLDAFQSMSIDWLMVLSFGKGKLGGWVSENFLGFSRILLWFYQNLEEAAEIVEDVPPAGVPQANWTLKHNRYWLKVRGLDASGKATELRERVAGYMKLEEVPEPIEYPERKVEHVEAALASMVDLLKCVMTPEVTLDSVNKASYAIRIFLSAFDKLDETLRDLPSDDGANKETTNHTTADAVNSDEPKKLAKKNIAVVSSYNFPCLMNLPQTMSTYGPLRDLWEGGPRGEGYLRFAKPLMSQGFRTKWSYHLLSRLQRMQAFENVLPTEHDALSPPASRDALKNRNSKFHQYGSAKEAQDGLMQCLQKKKKPISVVILDKGQGDCMLLCVVGEYQKVLVVTVSSTCAAQKKFGLVYHKYYPDAESLSWESDVVPSMSNDARIGYGVLLPLLETDNEHPENSRLFALVASNWRVLDESTTLKDLV